MKKIIAGAAIAALSAGLVFADNPAINLNVVDFTGNAAVEWGTDLDAGKTGFKNKEYMKFSINLFDAATKSTEANGDVWAELVLKAGNTKNWNHRLFYYESTVEYNGIDQNADLSSAQLSFDLDTAKLHFGNVFVGIQNGDTTTGTYKFDGAIRSADNGNAQWLSDVGPAGYTQGIVAGYDDSNLNVAVDFRSKPQGTTNQYTDNYAIAAEAKLKDGNEWVNGLFVDVGGSVNLSEFAWTKDANSKAVKELFTIGNMENKRTFGYSANAGYKLNIDEKLYVKPAVGLTGTYTTAYKEINNKKAEGSQNDNNLVFGAILGWGATADANAGVYYLDGDCAKKVTPGLSVVAAIPLPTTGKSSYDGKTTTSTTYDAVKAIIVPSFFTGSDLVPNLKFAAYSEIAILDYVKAEDRVTGTDNTVTKGSAAVEGETMAFALAAGVAYDVKVDAITVTPKAGMRFANEAYFDNNINGKSPLSSNKVFDKTAMGAQKINDTADSKKKGFLDAGFFNLKLGCDVAGLINNTTFYVVYESANLMNNIDYCKEPYDKDAKYYNVKAGTFTVGTKISF